MKNRSYNILLLTILISLALSISPGCQTVQKDILTIDNEGNTSINTEALDNIINQEATSELSVAEKEGILYMRQEEKLARDVYSVLYEIWGIKNFNNIGSSEQTHMDAMKSLIDRYGLTDPVKGRANGEFQDNKLQKLYDDLIASGSKSEIDALKVGAAIEEIDIIDIEKYITKTDKQDIITVYENLLKGSRNHLRSFVSVMEKQGVVYKPQYLSDIQYNDIISAPIERGKE